MERVCIYNRCSTEEESQKNALEVQAQESVEIANKFKDWLIVDHFVESQSGTTTKGRSKYQSMIEAIESKRYTVIMIKSIDRLVRNTFDWYKFLDCITRNHVKLYIYMDNKFYSQDDALITGIKAMLADEFSRELSKKIKNAHRRRQMKKSGLNITTPMFGWDKVERNVYIINEEEAEIIKEVCTLLEKGYGFGRVSRYMYNRGVRSKNGIMITDVAWRDMIRSPRMHGTMVLHQFEYDFNLKKNMPVPEEEWIYIENALPAIITKEHHERLLKILDERAERFAIAKAPSRLGDNDLSGKIFCGECGNVFHRRYNNYADGRKTTWACSRYIKLRRKSKENPDGCNNIIIVDELLRNLVVAAYRERFGLSAENNMNIIDETLSIVRKTFAGKKNSSKIAKLQKEIDKIEKNKSKAFEKLMDGTVTDDDYKLFSNKYNEQLKKLTEELTQFQSEMQEIIDYEQRLLDIKKELKETNIIDEAANEDIFKKVEYIKVFIDGNIEIKFDRFKILNIGSYGINTSDDMDDLYTITKRYEFISMVDQRVDDRIKDIEAYVDCHDIINISDVQAEFNLKYPVAYAVMKRLKEDGKVEFIRMSHGGFWRKVGSNVMLEGKRSLISPDGIYDKIYKYIEDNGKARACDIAEYFGLSETNTYDKLKTLRNQNKIYFVYDGPEGHWFLLNQDDENEKIKPMKLRIEEYMQNRNRASIRQVMDDLNISHSTARVRMRELKAEGKVDYTKNGSAGGYWYWKETNNLEEENS